MTKTVERRNRARTLRDAYFAAVMDRDFAESASYERDAFKLLVEIYDAGGRPDTVVAALMREIVDDDSPRY